MLAEEMFIQADREGKDISRPRAEYQNRKAHEDLYARKVNQDSKGPDRHSA
jgi:hypothetical protein